MSRITQQSSLSAMRADLSGVSSRLFDIQRQVASGKTLERLGCTVGRFRVALHRRSLRTFDQYERNLSDAANWLGAADTAFSAIDDRLNRVQDLTIQADNGSLGPAARTAIATELRSIADEMVGLMNSNHLGRPLFAGTAGGAEAYDTSGNYLGDAGVVERTVSTGSTFQVNAIRPEVFGVSDPGDPINGNIVEWSARSQTMSTPVVVNSAGQHLRSAKPEFTPQATFGGG